MPSPDQPTASFGSVDVFVDEMFPAELEEIRKRRQNLIAWHTSSGIEGTGVQIPVALPAAEELGRPVVPDVKFGLVGLAFSGGGIRSAAFNLGVAQGLVGNGLWPMIDYLSTVSGGGYIGACIDTVMSEPSVRPTRRGFPLHFDAQHAARQHLKTALGGQGTLYSEPPALRHLRDNARYLAPGKSMDYLLMPLLVIKGLLINLIAILAYSVGVTCFVVAAFAGLYRLNGMIEGIDHTQNVPWDLWYIEPCIFIGLGVFLVVSAVVEFRVCNTGLQRENTRRWLVRGSVTLLTLTVLAAQPWMVAGLWKVAHPAQRTWNNPITWAGVVGAISVLFHGLSLVKHPPRWVRLAFLTLIGLIGPLLIYLALCLLAGWLWYGVDPTALPINYRDWPGVHAEGLWDRFGMTCAITAGVNLLIVARFNVNLTSMLFFYRDRLSCLFLFRATDPTIVPNPANEIQPLDDLKLSDLNPKGSLAPYHLINAAVNLQGSTDRSLRGRQADFFLFSKHFIGSSRTRYCRTPELEAAEPDLNLGLAVAISGAAVAPNMGTETFRPLVFILTLLNVRLGYWLPNPRLHTTMKTATSDTKSKPVPFIGTRYLSYELFSKMREDSERVNVTDGGHIENLGVYELLRRRCRIIIACDAEADPKMTFPSLARLIRYARTDMGIDIKLNIDPIRLEHAKDGKRAHVVTGEITFPGGGKGTLIYLKSTLTASESLYVRQQPTLDEDKLFPHTPTAQQSFTEGQFECYRALGHHIANTAFADKGDAPPKGEWVRESLAPVQRCEHS